MKYVTVKMISEHAGKAISSVIRALQGSGIELKREPGVHGFRIPLAVANKFLARQWPECGPMKIKALEAASV